MHFRWRKIGNQLGANIGKNFDLTDVDVIFPRRQ